MSDSAGVPWEGRRFEHNSWGDDDGTAPQLLLESIRRFRSAEVGETEVVNALRTSRLLIPLLAQLGEVGVNEGGHTIDKSQELSIITVAGPDGRAVMPAFTSVDAMRQWNPAARPVPTPATRVALAAVGEGTDLLIIDPTSATEFGVRRPALLAIAESREWTPSYLDAEVDRAFADAAATEPAVRAVALAPGDSDARLGQPELVVQLWLEPGLDPQELARMLDELQLAWSQNVIIATRVDSLKVQLLQAS